MEEFKINFLFLLKKGLLLFYKGKGNSTKMTGKTLRPLLRR
jgi:hypothetical protein